MMAGIAAAVPGASLADISGAIEDVATPGGYGIVRQFVGHGIGTEMHQEPQVPNYRTGVRGMKLEPGICLAIEPMLTLGNGEVADPAGRLDGRDRRRLARGPFRAHDRGHRPRPGDPDDGLMTTVLAGWPSGSRL